jgi:hypothetical protein
MVILIAITLISIFTVNAGYPLHRQAGDPVPTQPPMPPSWPVYESAMPRLPEDPVIEPVMQAAQANPTTSVLPASAFGLELFPLSNQGGLQLAQTSYTNWVRGAEIVWKDVEATQGIYNWSAIDAAVTEIENAHSINPDGINIIVTVRGTPDWAQANYPFSCGPIKGVNNENFGDFIVALIDELEGRGVDYVKYWEIWNEPDIPAISVSDPHQPWGGCWGDENDDYYGGRTYGEMLKVIYPLIKTRDPQSQVLVGGLNLDCDPRNPPAGKTCKPSKFLEGILLAGAGSAFDGVAFHAFDYISKDQSGNYLLGQYRNGNWPGSAWNEEGPALVQKARFLKSVLTQYGYGQKYLINTENSLLDSCSSPPDPCWPTYYNPFPPTLETTKAYYLARAYAAAQAEGLRANIWFDLTGSWLRNNGLVKIWDLTTLPAWNAYTFAAEQAGNSGAPLYVGDYSFVGKLSLPGVAGYEFSVIPTQDHDPYHIWLLWSKDGADHTITLPAPAQKVYGVQGDEKFGGAAMETLTISLEPYYLIMDPVTPRLRLPIILNNYYPGIVNGDFENGFLEWTTRISGLPVSLVTNPPLDPRDATGQTSDAFIPSGTRTAILGNSALGFGDQVGKCTPSVPVGFGAVERSIVVPNIPGKNPNLTFKYIIYSQDSSGDLYDQFEVWIGSTAVFKDGNKSFDNNNRCLWYRVPGPGNNARNSQTSGWATGTVDLNAYRGQTITVSFRNYNRPDGYYNTYTYLDDVQVLLTP